MIQKYNQPWVKYLDLDSRLEYWMDNWTVSDVTGHAGVIEQYVANAII